MKVAHLSNVIDMRTNSGTARAAIEIITKLSEDPTIKQTLIHFDKYDHPIYSLPNVTELVIPLKRFPFASHTFSFLIFWVKANLNKSDYQFDAVHWHASRVYPFFYLIPAHTTLITLHDATNRIFKKVNTIWTRMFYWNLRLSQKRIDFIIGDSNHACKNLISVARFESSKVKSVYLASNFDRVHSVKPQNFDYKSYLLCVSRWQPYKNVSTLLKGYDIAYKIDSSVPNLILVGKPVNGFTEPAELISQLGLENKVVVLQDLSDAELAFLYDHALVHISPSLYEGFGLPVLEGLKRNCPSLDHVGTSTSEISGPAGLHIDMSNVNEISNSIIMLTRDKNIIDQQRRLAYSRSQSFTWDKTVFELKKLYLSRIHTS